MKKARPHLFVPSAPYRLTICAELAKEIGLGESIMLLQIEYLLRISATEEVDGVQWTYQSAENLKAEWFPFWSRATIRRILSRLVEKKFLRRGNFNRKKYDRTSWYSLNFEGLGRLTSLAIVQNEARNIQNEARHAQNEAPIPKIPTKIPTKIPKDTAPSARTLSANAPECPLFSTSLKTKMATKKDQKLETSPIVVVVSRERKEKEEPLRFNADDRERQRFGLQEIAAWRAEHAARKNQEKKEIEIAKRRAELKEQAERLIFREVKDAEDGIGQGVSSLQPAGLSV